MSVRPAFHTYVSWRIASSRGASGSSHFLIRRVVDAGMRVRRGAIYRTRAMRTRVFMNSDTMADGVGADPSPQASTIGDIVAGTACVPAPGSASTGIARL